MDVGRSAFHVQVSMRLSVAYSSAHASLGLALILCSSASTAPAQFAPGLMQNASYWGDGKSEVDLYDAQFVRDGQPHQCEVLLTLTPGFVDPTTLASLENPKQPDALPVIRMNENATVPRGIFAEQRSLNALWRLDFASLARISAVGTDGLGNFAKSVYETREASRISWCYSSDTYRGTANSQEIANPQGVAIFYDELPLRVRTIDFSKASGEFDALLAPTLVTPAKEPGAFKPAKFSWKIGDRGIEVTVRHEGGTDHFVLDRDFPFLLREWSAADGNRWRLKNSLKADYWNYGKNGDRERALHDPMLRHPD
jgi:hypothetical protein